MMTDWLWLPALVLAYLMGSLSFAVLVSRLMGLSDPRTYGSQNPGATNVLRSGNKVAAALTLLLDAFKGWLPVWLVLQWGPQLGLGWNTVALVGLAAFLGHLYPVFLRFQGGKGVATAAGVLLAFEPWLGVAVLGAWVLTLVGLRYSSLAAIVAALTAPLLYWLGGTTLWQVQPAVGIAITAMSALLLWRHSGNIQRLLAGQESKVGSKKS
ncbi:glycerol-3-phosphate 1-O-acyltransferase PlsY [Serpentinomonas raichei]|uniref:glycerol-3-phosphate 1-O-acyltransferase PlsY n=1 Tax=Serpentinimonas barnesii TaxID=1458427 RepID=UPI0004957550